MALISDGPQMRLATPADLHSLETIEALCFDPARRSTRRSLMRSLQSDRQRVGLAVSTASSGEEAVLGAAVLFLYQRSIRIYSVATLPEARGKGIGECLMRWADDQAGALGVERISLEVDAANPTLLNWYQKHHFKSEDPLPDYYGPGEHAMRMIKELSADADPTRVVLVTEAPEAWDYALPNVTAVTPDAYLSDPSWQRPETLRVLNVCSNFNNDTLGYYTSLLAAARNHRISPDVIAIKDMTARATRRRLSEQYASAIKEAMNTIVGDEYVFPVVFEHSLISQHHALARTLSRAIGAPLMTITFRKITDKFGESHWRIKSIKALGLAKALKQYREVMNQSAPLFFSKRRFQNIKTPTYRYDLAILVNPDEENPPSCPRALDMIQQAAERCGFYVERITAKDRRRVPEFDALFIRETTGVNHHTYRISREAVTEGLIVMDDPWSILRCSNKIYLYERLTRARIRQPRAWLFYDGIDWRSIHKELPFPLVIKRPEGCFSTGVFRAENPEELDVLLKRLFQDMDVVIGQEFLPSSFDWRIGILNNQPLFACKYYMATGHWQVYNWASESEGADGFHKVGNSDCIPLAEVPAAVINTAKRAAACIGDGLYGVDLKESGGKVYVIEVNDNPNIDADVEDIIEGEQLYDRLAEDLARRIEAERSHLALVVSK